MTLPDKAAALLDGPTIVMLTTLNPDGSPQSTPVWAERDGDDVLISTVKGRKKARNLERDPRVSVAFVDPADPFSFFSLSGAVTVTDDADGSLIQSLAQKYIGGPYTMDEGTGNERVIIRLHPTSVVGR
jgi:PPOX class probable F420-dependent enzyme